MKIEISENKNNSKIKTVSENEPRAVFTKGLILNLWLNLAIFCTQIKS